MVPIIYHVIVVLSALLNLATGALSVAIVCLRTYPNDISSVLVIACSSLLCGLCQLLHLVRRSRLVLVFNTLTTATVLVTLGAGFSHCYFTLDNLTLRGLDRPLLTAHLSVLLASMMFNGMHQNIMFSKPYMGHSKTADCQEEVLNQKLTTLHADDEKFVALKASAQTLTPELEVATEKNWMNEYPTNYSGSDATSTPSVVKHKLPYLNSESHKKSAKSNRTRNSSFTAISPPYRKLVFEKLQRKFSIRSPTGKNATQIPKNEITDSSFCTETKLDAKYVTRLSTIPDVSKSYLNILRQTNDVSDVVSMCLNDTENIDTNLLNMEKDAINLYDRVLLPSILQNTNNMKSSVSEPIESTDMHGLQNSRNKDSYCSQEQDTDTILEQLMESELDIYQPQDIHVIHNSKSEPILNRELGNSTITMDYWEKNQDTLIKNEKKEYSDEAKKLCSPFKVDKAFSFPLKKQTSHQTTRNGSDEVMSFVDKAVNSHDAHLMEEGLKQQGTSYNSNLAPTSNIAHSPTKSISSIATAIRTPIKFNFGVFSPQEPRDESQISLYLSTNQSKLSASAQSSPTKLGKRLSQRLSRSNLKSDEYTNQGNNLHFHSKSLTLSSFNLHSHSKSNSVNHIDLSYVHSLQQKHSPQKSVCTLNARRRSSIYQSVNEIRVSTLNLSRPTNDPSSQSDLDSPGIEEDITEFGSNLSFESKEITGTDAGLSEYDREKLSILLNRQQIQNK